MGGAIYLGTILLFALSYLLVPCTEWGGSEKITSFLDSLYFSVVTITSLGFGDTFLVSGSPYRVLVIVEAIIGILIIGFFLNDIAMSQTRYFDTYFRNQDALYEELRMFATTADLKDWPELEKALFRFISLHQQFQFKEAILSNMKTYLGTGVDQVIFTDHLSQAIREHDGNLRFRSGNAMTPYEVLFSSLKENVNAIKEVHRLIKEVSYNN